jgi:hypothetical protein
VVKEGPTALFTTTTSAALDPEYETRTLAPTIRDDAAQTRAVMRGAARRSMGDAPAVPDLTPWHALQRWLEAAGERRVLIPYAMALADRVHIGAIRMRRDFNKLLTLIKASAILHQVQRDKTKGGVIIASRDDYRIVRELLAESFAAAQQDGLTDAQRAAVTAVGKACQARGAAATEGVGLRAVADLLQLDKSVISRRLANPIKQGYVINLESRNGHPGRYVLGDALPPILTMLPDPDDLDMEVGEV